MNLHKCALIVAVTLGISDGFTAADEPATQRVDKSQYTLFHPTPADQMREMDTDRPNVTNTPHTIDAGHLQLETGLIDYSYFRQHSAGASARNDDFSFGQFNFRLGVLNNLELNAAIDALELDRTHGGNPSKSSTSASFGDTVFGAKVNLWGNETGDDAWESALAIQPQLKFPTARDSVGNGRFEGSVAAPFLLNLPKAFHFSYQPGLLYERNTKNTGYVAGFENAASIDRVVFRNLDLYLEYACFVTTERHTEPVQLIDFGGVYQLTENLVLDTGLTFGLNRASTNFELTAGISLRF